MFALTLRLEVWFKNLKRSEQPWKNLDNPNDNEESNDARVGGERWSKEWRTEIPKPQPTMDKDAFSFSIATLWKIFFSSINLKFSNLQI